MSHSEEVLAATARRTEITTQLLELLTSDAFTTAELQRLRFVGLIFGIETVVKELTSEASSLEGRTDLALAVVMAGLQIAMDDTPPAPPQRVLERREAQAEARAAEREWKQRHAGGGSGDAPAATKSVKVKGISRTAKYYHTKRAKMTEAELAADRAKRAAVMREIRAKKKAANQERD